MKNVKNRIAFIALILLYIISYLYLCVYAGMFWTAKVYDFPILGALTSKTGVFLVVLDMQLNMFIWVLLSFFLVLFILWQTKLEGPALNRKALIFLGLNLILTIISDIIIDMIKGEVKFLGIAIITIWIVVFLSILVGISLLITYFVQKRNGLYDSYIAYSDVMTEEEFENMMRKRNEKKLKKQEQKNKKEEKKHRIG